MINLFKRKKMKRINTFNEMVDIGKSIISANKYTDWNNSKLEYNEHPIIAYINLLGRKTQSEALLETFKTEIRGYDTHYFTYPRYYEFMHCRINTPDSLYPLSPYEIMIHTKENIIIDLNKNLIIPWPWNRGRLVSNLSRCEQWIEDTKNHFVYVWMPIGICWVSGGNHSIATGILRGQGQIKNAKKIDISPLYQYIFTDGVNYYNKLDNSILCRVEDLEFAAIFEIGRIMVDNNISFTGY